MKVNQLQSIKVRSITEADFKYVWNWSRDDDFCQANEWSLNRTEEELWGWWLRCVNNDSSEFRRLGIEYEDRLIGYADLANIEGATAELGIAIGESALWGRGLGYLAALKTLDYGAENLGITNFLAETHEANVRSQRMLAKLGFVEISRIGAEDYRGRRSRLIQYRLTR